MRATIWLLILLISLFFIGCDKEMEAEKTNHVDIGYDQLETVPSEGTALAVSEIETMDASEIIHLANAKNEIEYRAIMEYADAKAIAKGQIREVSVDKCTGTQTCSFKCGGTEYRVTGIPNSCSCTETFGPALIISCSNGCPSKQVACIRTRTN